MNKCFLVYDYITDLPAAVFDNMDALSVFMGRSSGSLISQISRLKTGKIKYTADKEGHKYQIFKVEI